MLRRHAYPCAYAVDFLPAPVRDCRQRLGPVRLPHAASVVAKCRQSVAFGFVGTCDG